MKDFSAGLTDEELQVLTEHTATRSLETGGAYYRDVHRALQELENYRAMHPDLEFRTVLHDMRAC